MDENLLYPIFFIKLIFLGKKTRKVPGQWKRCWGGDYVRVDHQINAKIKTCLLGLS